jgi:hypothetical protein
MTRSPWRSRVTGSLFATGRSFSLVAAVAWVSS